MKWRIEDMSGDLRAVVEADDPATALAKHTSDNDLENWVSLVVKGPMPEEEPHA